MSDVIKKAIDANDVLHNGVVVAVMKNGTSHRTSFGDNVEIPLSGVVSKYDARFDDITYYTT